MIIRKAILASAVSLCVLAGALVCASAPVLAAPEAVVIESESVRNVASTSATLQAQVNPGGGEATYHFEYGTSVSYGARIPSSDAEVGSGSEGIGVALEAQGLQPGTTYHYRVVATNALGPVDGADGTFTTQPVASEFALPDGRQYEMVSPPQKEGGEVTLEGLGGGNSSAASTDGTKVAYLATRPFAGPTANANDVQILSTRGPDGWTSQDVSPPHDTPAVLAGEHETEFRGFSADLSHAVVIPFGHTTLSQVAAEGYWIGFLRDNLDGSYEPLLKEAPEAAQIFNTAIGFYMRFSGGTPDLSHIVFESPSGLTSNAEPTSSYFPGNLYEWASGHFQLVSVLPGGESAGGAEYVGISEDGTRVLWSTVGGSLYVRDVTTEKTYPVGASTYVKYAAISRDGSKVFYPSASGMYEVSLDSSSAEPGETVNLVGGEIQYPAYVDHDGTTDYFANRQGALYVARDNGTTWTSTLLTPGIGEEAPPLTGAVASDGRYFAFDDKGEVRLYDANADSLVCVSCNSTGGQPLGGAALNVLTGSGRVFFTSSDALVAHDTNGDQDVYEWEPEHVGSCATAPGCVYLISSGTSNDSSTFLGASANGDDVFFSTRGRLAAQDFDSSFDVYDAHVCTAAEPCPASDVSPPACTSSDACKAAPTPQPGIFGAPASATFVGAGDVVASTPKPVSKSKPKAKKRAKKKHRKAKARKSKAKKAAVKQGLSAKAKS